jgi:hypothetical protein
MFGSTIDIVKVLNGIEQQMRLDLLLAAFIQVRLNFIETEISTQKQQERSTNYLMQRM